MFAIVDYDTGNTLNLKKALNYENINNQLTADPDNILSADAIILPGVGAFKAAMDALQQRNLVEVIQKAAEKKIPILGICLGMQLLFDDSEEYGLNSGLSLIPGHIKRIPTTSGLKVPQMGWNQNQLQQPTSDFRSVDQQYTYFVHSYYADCDAKYIVSSADYGVQVPSIVQNQNVVGMQFHPEKSGQVGLNLLKKFQEMVKKNDFSRN